LFCYSTGKKVLQIETVPNPLLKKKKVKAPFFYVFNLAIYNISRKFLLCKTFFTQVTKKKKKYPRVYDPSFQPPVESPGTKNFPQHQTVVELAQRTISLVNCKTIFKVMDGAEFFTIP
jgi:hypothetical protein